MQLTIDQCPSGFSEGLCCGLFNESQLLQRIFVHTSIVAPIAFRASDLQNEAMRKRNWIIGGSAVVVVALLVGAFALGNYVYREGTSVPCAPSPEDVNNTPASFKTPVDGPFADEKWSKWIGYDLSDWWLTDSTFETVTIPVADGVQLEGWWVAAEPADGQTTVDETVIVTHGYGTSRRDFNALLPTSMLVKGGFNVLLVDQRDMGDSTCVDGQHSAGQDESDDFAAVAEWVVAEKGVDPAKLGMFGVSGGAIATAVLPAKTDKVQAFALESPIFDFHETARREVVYQGFPEVLWTLADLAARIQGVNLNETSVPEGIDAAGKRPILLLHGTDDQRLAYEGAVKFLDYGKSVGVNVRLETFNGADHTEGMLTETERYAEALTSFFRAALGKQ